jgi:hypothetical protein
MAKRKTPTASASSSSSTSSGAAKASSKKKGGSKSPKQKKAKTTPIAADDDDSDVVVDILEQTGADDETVLAEIRRVRALLQAEPTKHINAILQLLAVARQHTSTKRGRSVPVVLAAAQALRHVFTALIGTGDVALTARQLQKKKGNSGATAQYREWLLAQYQAYVATLYSLLRHKDVRLQMAAFTFLHDLVGDECRSNDAAFVAGVYGKALRSVLFRPTLAPILRDRVLETVRHQAAASCFVFFFKRSPV